MAGTGHIRVGVVGGTLQPYILQGGAKRGRRRFLVNPYAEKLGSGEQKFSDNIQWEYWTLSDWTGGVGQVDPEGGGFLYGELVSHVPRQLILPQALYAYSTVLSDTSAVWRAYTYVPRHTIGTTSRSTLTLGPGASGPYLSVMIDGAGDGTAAISKVWVYGECANGTILRADIYSNSGGNPNATLANGSLTVSNTFPGAQWYGIPVTYTATVTTEYHIVIRPTSGSIILHGSDDQTLVPLTVNSSADGTVWNDVTNFQPFYHVTAKTTAATVANASPTNMIKIVYGEPTASAANVVFVGKLTEASTYTALFKQHSIDPELTYIDGVAGTNPVDAAVAFGLIWVAMGSGANMYTWTLNPGTETDSGVTADRLLNYRGYLYRAIGQNVYYTTDGTTWSSAITVCNAPAQIRSMGGLEQDIYIACDDGLYRLAPGDFIEGVLPWPHSSNNGTAMVNHGGALYLIVHGRVHRYTADGSLADIWIVRDDDLPAGRLGEVITLAVSDLGPIAIVKDTTADIGRCSVWVFLHGTWHHLATLPTTLAQTAYYSRTDYSLFVGCGNGEVFGIYMPSFASNPYNDTNSRYMTAGWIQWYWFDGRVLNRDKDYNAVTIYGENISAARPVRVYWQDDASTDWELLGTATGNVSTLTWSNYTVRPATKRLKLGLLLETDDGAETPRVQAVAVEFLANVTDRYGWVFAIMAGDDLEGTNGELLAQTGAQMKTQLDGLEQQTPPFTLEDIDGVQYTVRVTKSGQDVVDYERILDGSKEEMVIYNWTVEEQ